MKSKKVQNKKSKTYKNKTYKKIQNNKNKTYKNKKSKTNNIKSCIHASIMKDEISRIQNITKRVKIHNSKNNSKT